MTTIPIVGEVDTQHQLHALVPPSVPPGSVKLLLVLADEDDEPDWMRLIAHEWSEELSDPREDIYMEIE